MRDPYHLEKERDIGGNHPLHTALVDLALDPEWRWELAEAPEANSVTKTPKPGRFYKISQPPPLTRIVSALNRSSCARFPMSTVRAVVTRASTL
jgi:hypothetical protein